MDDLVEQSDGIAGTSYEMYTEGIFGDRVRNLGEEFVGHREGVLRELARILGGC